MRFPRRRTRWLCGWLSVVLLSMQFVTTAYACPTPAAPGPATAMRDMPDCDGDRPTGAAADQLQLCKSHCQQGAQAVHATPAADAPSAPLLLAVLDWARGELAAAPLAERRVVVASGAPPPGAPPLYLSLLVLRN